MDEAGGVDLRRVARVVIGVAMIPLVLALFPFTPDPAGDIKILVYSWAAAIAAAIALLGGRGEEGPSGKPRVFLGLLAVFLVLNLVACLRSAYIGHSLVAMSKLFSFFLLYAAAAYAFRGAEQVRRWMLIVCLAVAVSSLYAAFQHMGIDPFPWNKDPFFIGVYLELPGTFGNANFAAHTMMMCVIMAVYLAAAQSMRWCLAFVPVFLVHIYFTNQRASLIALAGAAALILVARLVRRWTVRPLRAAVITIAVTAVLGVTALAGAMAITKLRTGTAFPLDMSLLLRYKLYSSASTMILDRPLLGYGPGNYAIENPPYLTFYEQQWYSLKRLLNRHVHQDILEAAIDAGILAGALYLSFLVFGIGYGLLMAFTERDPLRRRLGYTFAALFFAFLIEGCFGFNLRVPVSGSLLFLLAGALEGVRRPRDGNERALDGGRDGARPPMLRFTRALGLGRRGRLPHVLWRVPVLALILINALFATRVFAAAVNLQRGGDALWWRAYREADEILARGEAMTPWNGLFAYHRGRAAQLDGVLPAAAEHFERSLSRNPYFIPAIMALAQTHFSLSVVPGSAGASEAAVAAALAHEEHAEHYARRALDLCAVLPEAEDLLGRVAVARALRLSTGAAWVASPKITSGNLGEAAQATLGAPASLPAAQADALWKEAEMRLIKALEYGASNTSEILRLLGQTYAASGQPARAEAAFIRACQAAPADSETLPVFYAFAETSGRLPMFKNVVTATIARIDELNLTDKDPVAAAYFWLARAEEKITERVPAAEAAYRSAALAAPSRDDIWPAFAAFAEQHARTESFRRTILEAYAVMKAAGIPPISPVAAAAEALEGGFQRLSQASATLLQAVRTHSAGTVGKLHAAYTPSTINAAADFIWVADLLVEEARQAPESTPGLGVAWVNLGIVLTEIGRLEAACAAFEKAAPTLGPQESAICAQYWSGALVTLERPADALRVLQSAAARAPGMLPLRLSLARTLGQSGRTAEARLEYQTLLSSGALTEAERDTIRKERDALPK